MIHFMPTTSFAHAMRQARQDLDDWNTMKGDDERARWSDWAGSELDGMMRSPHRTFACLHDANVGIRLAAVALIAGYWPPRQLFAEPCLVLAFEDKESAVRGAAFQALIQLRLYVIDETGFLARLLGALFGLPPEELRVEARHELHEGTRFRRRITREIMEELAGDHLDAMLSSRAVAERYLMSTDPNLRSAAIFVLSQNWPRTSEFAHRCEQILLFDSHLGVRLRAVDSLAAYYSRSDDQRIGGLLARVVYDANEPIELRQSAYCALYSVRGMPLDVKLNVLSPRFRFPDDVDWTFVRSFVRHGEDDNQFAS